MAVDDYAALLELTVTELLGQVQMRMPVPERWPGRYVSAGRYVALADELQMPLHNSITERNGASRAARAAASCAAASASASSSASTSALRRRLVLRRFAMFARGWRWAPAGGLQRPARWPARHRESEVGHYPGREGAFVGESEDPRTLQ